MSDKFLKSAVAKVNWHFLPGPRASMCNWVAYDNPETVEALSLGGHVIYSKPVTVTTIAGDKEVPGYCVEKVFEDDSEVVLTTPSLHDAIVYCMMQWYEDVISGKSWY